MTGLECECASMTSKTLLVIVKEATVFLMTRENEKKIESAILSQWKLNLAAAPPQILRGRHMGELLC